MADANSTTNPSGPNTCRGAAVTFVYNESFNLPLWRRHYGAQLGTENLFIVDDGSDDGSTDGILECHPPASIRDGRNPPCCGGFQFLRRVADAL